MKQTFLSIFIAISLISCSSRSGTTTCTVKFDVSKYTAPSSDTKIEFYPDTAHVRIRKAVVGQYYPNSKCWVYASVAAFDVLPKKERWIVVKENPYNRDTVVLEQKNSKYFYTFYRLATVKRIG
jgi:hypothetical protein